MKASFWCSASLAHNLTKFTKRWTVEKDKYTILKSQWFEPIYLTHIKFLFTRNKYAFTIYINRVRSFVWILFKVDKGNLQKREKLHWQLWISSTIHLFTIVQILITTFYLSDMLLDIIALNPNGSGKKELLVILTLWPNWQLETCQGATPQYEHFFYNFPYFLDSWRENRFHICLILKISERIGAAVVEAACVRVSLSLNMWGRERESEREGEMLGATGYLSRYNGVSYEKTSVNFLSALQQCITQSSHSADLWSCCLTESCHCS